MLKIELKKEYTKPMILSHQMIQFETAHSWNPGCGQEGKQNGNDGINWPSSNPNPVPDGAGGQCKKDIDER